MCENSYQQKNYTELFYKQQTENAVQLSKKRAKKSEK